MPVYKRDGEGQIIRKRGNVTKGVRWFFDFSHQGKRYKGSIPTAITKRDAEEAEREIRVQVEKGIYGKPSSKTTFESFVKDVYLKGGAKDKRSFRWDEQHSRILCRYFKGKILSEITPADLEIYKQERRQQTTQRGTLRAGSSVNRERALLSAIFSLAVDLGYCERNPVRKVRRYRETGRRLRVLSADEEARLNEALTCGDAWLRQVFHLALNTGMRLGEIFHLRWQDIDFEKNYLRTRPEKTKNGKARTLPVNDGLRASLLEIRGSKKEGELFELHPRTGSMRFSEICDQLGMPDVTLHTLRHTFASRLLEQGVNPFVVKELLGHSTLAMTYHYSHFDLLELQKAVKTLEITRNSSDSVPTDHESEKNSQLQVVDSQINSKQTPIAA